MAEKIERMRRLHVARSVLDSAEAASPLISVRLFRVLAQLLNANASKGVKGGIFPLDVIIQRMMVDARQDGRILIGTRIRQEVLQLLHILEANQTYGRVYLGRRRKPTRYQLWSNDKDDQALIEALGHRVGDSAQRRDLAGGLKKMRERLGQIEEAAAKLQEACADARDVLSGLGDL
jgi:hypothetical protein